METSTLAEGAHAYGLGNMRRAHLANMHRRVEADAQAACSRMASIQVRRAGNSVCCSDRSTSLHLVHAAASQAHRSERRTVARQRWKVQMRLVQHVVKSCASTSHLQSYIFIVRPSHLRLAQ